MKKFFVCLGIFWAFPITLVVFLYVGLFSLLGWYKFFGRRETALVWVVTDKSPQFLKNMWYSWGGQTTGNIIVMNVDPDSTHGKSTLTHELNHVDQYMRLGVFFIVMYGLFALVIKIACVHSNFYADNPFEIDAKRGAGQTTRREI